MEKLIELLDSLCDKYNVNDDDREAIAMAIDEAVNGVLEEDVSDFDPPVMEVEISADEGEEGDDGDDEGEGE